MNLFEIDAAIMRCFVTEEGEVVDTETGEIFDESYLDNLEMERQAKIRNIACWIKNLESDAEQLRAQKMLFDARMKVKANKAKSLREYLQKYLNGEKVETSEYKIGYRTTKAKVIIDDPMQIPSYFYKSPDDFTPSEREKMAKKTEIKKAIQTGVDVPGVHLEDSVSMQIK